MPGILETGGDRELANQYGRTGELQVQWKEDCLKNKVAQVVVAMPLISALWRAEAGGSL